MLQCRGGIPVKGKGEMVTYWVLPPMEEDVSIQGTESSDGIIVSEQHSA
jgi:hypothetical protein